MDFDLLKDEIRRGKFQEARSLIDKIEFENESLRLSYELLIDFEILDDKELVKNRSQEALEQILATKDWESISYLGAVHTQLLHYLGDLTGVINTSEHLLTIIPNPDDVEKTEVLNSLGFLFNTYGNALFRMGKYTEALDQYTKSLNIRESINDIYSIGASLGNIANIYNETGELKTAEVYQKRALNHFIDNNHEYESRVTYNNLGVVYLDMGRLDVAEEMFSKSLEIATKYQDDSLISTAYNNLGNVARTKNQIQQALDYFNQSLKIREKLKNSYQLVYSYYYLTLSYIDLGDIEKADLYLAKLKEIVDDNPDAKLFEMKYKILMAAKLKYSVRHTQQAKAQEILNQIIEDQDNYDVELKIQACIFQCEILLSELSAAQENELNAEEEEAIIFEVMEYTDAISEIAEYGNLTGMKIQTLILQAYISLSQFETDEAQFLISQAKELSERYGIYYFPIAIPNQSNKSDMSGKSYSPGSLEVKKSINKIIHSLPKLRIIFYLYDKPFATFTELKESLNFTPGKLGKHCDNLVEVGYIEKAKEFDGNKFQTIYRLTNLGIREFKSYAETLKYQLNVVEN